MKRELYLASALSAIWLTMSFLVIGALYSAMPIVLGWARFDRFENLLGTLDLPGDASIPWISLGVFGVTMFLAALPVNLYWFRRVHLTPRAE